MSSTIYIRNPYPFTYQERQAIEATISQLYGIQVVYVRDFPQGESVDHLSVMGGNKTTLGHIGHMLKAFHLCAVKREKIEGPVNGYSLSEDIEIVHFDFLGSVPAPAWALPRKEERDGSAT